MTTVNKRVQRLFRVSDAALRTALPMGAMAALFIGVEAAFAVHRGRQNLMLDSTVGGAAVAAVYSGAVAGPAAVTAALVVVVIPAQW